MKVWCVTWVLGCLWGVGTAGFAADVEIPDPQLDTAIRELLKKKQIDKLDKAVKLTEEDLATIFILEFPKRGIESLVGLDKCKNLAQVKLTGNKITDVGPLAACGNIQSLDLAQNTIADITPLAKLVKLQYLQLEGNLVADLAPLAELKPLTALYLGGNQVESLAPLAGLPKLTSLYLAKNRVRDLGPLSGVKWLSSLDLRENQIVDVAPLASLTELRYTFLDRNQIADIAPLVAAAKKDAEGEKRFAPYWTLQLSGNPLSDGSKGALATLKELGVRVKFE